MNQPLARSTRRRPAHVAIAVATTLLLLAKGVPVLRNWSDGTRSRVLALHAQSSRQRWAASHRQEVAQAVAQQATAPGVSEWVHHAPTLGSAGAVVATLLRSVLDSADARTGNLDIRSDSVAGALALISARVELEGSTADVADALAMIESTRPRLVIRELALSRADESPSGDVTAPLRALLRIAALVHLPSAVPAPEHAVVSIRGR